MTEATSCSLISRQRSFGAARGGSTPPDFTLSFALDVECNAVFRLNQVAANPEDIVDQRPARIAAY